ncbi:MAG: DUF4070 domain-containing protein [Planctomycetales bacterium]|nr:DUF4070 domain-containing protein [Planctomycetales bacterium]
MKILLVNPEVPATFWSLKHALNFISKKALLPPLGLLTVAAMLPASWEKKLIDLNVTRLRDRHLKWADMVFLTGMVIQKTSVDQIVERCRAMNVKIAAGGPLFTAFPEAYLDIDHLVLEEAEITLPAFLTDLERGCPEPFYTTRQRPDLKATPIPQWDLIDMKKYALMGIQYSRGCPFNCDFCDVTRLFGHVLRTKTTAQILAELDALYAAGWRGELFFVDDNFIGKKQALKNDLLPAMIQWMDAKKHPFWFNTQASLNLADDDELMTLMARAGFDCVFVGVESPDETSLAECNKTQNTGRDLVAAIKKIQRFGMQVQAGFIVGFDSDKPGVFDKMIALIQDSGIVTAMVGLLNAPRGTHLYKKLIQENRLTNLPTGNNMDCTMNFIPKMEMHELLGGYRKVLDTIYSQKYYYQRIRTFLENYNFSGAVPLKIRYSSVKAFFRSLWRIGVLEKGNIHYWKLLFWSLRKPERLPWAVRFSIYGFHFRKTLKSVYLQVNELAAVANACGPEAAGIKRDMNGAGETTGKGRNYEKSGCLD